jgi:alpha-L-rhamnosidase
MQANHKLFILLLFFSFGFSPIAKPNVPYFLRVDYCENPMGITHTKPVFSWLLKENGRSEKQAAFQILVSTTTEKLSKNIGDVWSTGWVNSDQQNGITYQG